MVTSTTMTRSWSDLLPELLDIITRKIQFVRDFCTFRSVCSSWRSAAPYANFDGTRQFPWLLKLPKNYCLGWKGWILAVDGSSGDMKLRHAILQDKTICVPSIKSWDNNSNKEIILSSVQKAALSSNPFTTPSDFTLLVLYRPPKCINRNQIALWRPTDTEFREPRPKAGYTPSFNIPSVHDVIFYKGSFYAVTCVGEILQIGDDGAAGYSYKIVGSGPAVRWPGMQNERDYYYFYYYLVELDGRLLLLARRDTTEFGCTTIVGEASFRVFVVLDSNGAVLDSSNEALEVHDLGDAAIFVGRNTSFSVNKASEIPDCEPNCVYATNHGTHSNSFLEGIEGQVRAYNLKDHKTVYREFVDGKPPLLWVMPTFT